MVKKAVVLGSFEHESDKNSYVLTKSAETFDKSWNGNLVKTINIIGPVKKGKSRLLYNVGPDYDVVAVVGLGPVNAGYNELEEIEEGRENVRAAVACGVKCIRELNSEEYVIDVDDCNDPEAASEGSHLSIYHFDELKQESSRKKPVKLSLLNHTNDASKTNQWNKGTILAYGQNMCRRLMEMPANLMTPTIFAENAAEACKKHGVKLEIRDKQWIMSQKMNSFLSVAKGSDEPPVFLEVHYNNKPDVKPIVIVGKGICFDSGGISLKPALNMDKMRADCGGAANVLSSIVTLAMLKAKVHVIGLIPLCENLPSGKANKPGDVVTAMNGKTIQIDNTDAEGRLILADGLHYAHHFDPELIMDIATLTGAMAIALGPAATGVFSTSAKYWEIMQKCGAKAGDRVWRMPLFSMFTKWMTDSILADLNNIGGVGKGGGACAAAAFLREFVNEKVPWMHMDMAGVMESKDDPYLGKGMSGRPLRTLVTFFECAFHH